MFSPNSEIIGQNVEKYGISKTQLVDGYSGYFKIGKKQYYGVISETSDKYLIMVLPERIISEETIIISLVTVVTTLISLLLSNIILIVHSKKSIYESINDVEKDNNENDFLEQEKLKLTNIFSGKKEKSKMDLDMELRWNINAVSWIDKTPEQKLITMVKGILFIFAFIICIIFVFGDRLLNEDSIFLYIIDGNWEKTVNIFSISSCFVTCNVVAMFVWVARKVVFWIAKVSNPKVETVCHLISSLITYVSGIVVLYFCFTKFGVDTKTLLASAGIVSLIIGLALKDMITDIIAGLFIILEDEFRVDDFIDVGGFYGVVMVIGVRTTKIERNGQTKVVNNSDIRGVLNMSGKIGRVRCKVGVDYRESLERIEAILSEELPLMTERLPGALATPVYRGISELGQNCIYLRIDVRCVGYMVMRTSYSLNRELKLLFEKHNITVPYQQVVVSKPADME